MLLGIPASHAEKAGWAQPSVQRAPPASERPRHAVSRPGELDPDVQGPGLRVDTSAEVPKMFVDRDRARLEIVVQGHARLVSDEEPEMDLSFVRGVLDTFQLQAPEPR